jgi:hypothetical protein
VDWNKIAWIAMAWVFAWSLTRQLTAIEKLLAEIRQALWDMRPR